MAVSRVNTLVDRLTGKYFTTTQISCGNSQCDQCKNANVIATDWLKSTMGLVPNDVSLLPQQYRSSTTYITSTAWSCAGFANYCLWYIYAQNPSDKVTGINLFTGQFTKSNMDASGVRTGDVIRIDSGTHSFVYISHDSSGVTVLDSNWTTGHGNYVQKHVFTWSQFSGTMAITRGKNWTGTSNNDYTAPAVSNVTVSDVNASGYTITCEVTDPNGVQKVEFPTWTLYNGQDDLLWKDGTISGSKVTFRVNTADHNNEKGDYVTDIYATDMYGNVAKGYRVNVLVDVTSPVISNAVVSNIDATGYTITCTVTDPSGLQKVEFPTWTVYNGQDDILWKNGTISGSKVTFRVNTADHNNEKGDYVTDIYATDKLGNFSQGYRVNVTLETKPPVISDVKVTNITSKGYRVSCKVSDASGISHVQFPTWTDQGFQDDLVWHKGTVQGNTAYCDILTSAHNNENGMYYTHIYAYDKLENDAMGGVQLLVGNALKVNSSNTAALLYKGTTHFTVFTPTETAQYVIRSTGEAKAEVSLYDANGNQLATSHDNNGANGFRLVSELKSGTPYYFGVRYTDTTKKGNIPFSFGRLYTVKFNANGGMNAPSTQTKTHDAALTLSTAVPSRNGYTFLGWATSSNATAAQYQAGASFTANADTTLYAVWKANTYTVSYNANGGTNAPSDQTKTHDAALTLSTAVPSRSGYTFLGWATDKSATTAIYQAGSSFTTNADTTLYAVWKANTYTVSYNANGGTNAPSAQTKTHDVALKLSSTVPTRPGYTFLGWATDKSATTAIYQAGSSFTTNADTTLYAVWKAYTYNVSYDANGGSNAPTDQIKTHDVVLTLSAIVPTRDGYTFLGWATDKSATTAIYQAGGAFTTNADTTLYAVWKANTYTVSYNANGGTNAPNAQIKTHDVALTLFSTIPTRDGYTFLGWATNSSTTTATYQAGDSFTANANTTLYAVWEEIVVAGDVNGDKVLNTTDARYVLKGIVGLAEPTAEETRIADLNNDGKINSADVRSMLLMIASET